MGIKRSDVSTTDFFQVNATDRHLPEKRLLCAVLQRAIIDCIDQSVDRNVRKRALKYFTSDSRKAFSLWWICQQLWGDGGDRVMARLRAELPTLERPKGVIFRVDTR